MIDLTETFDVQALTEQDLYHSEMSPETSGRNKFLFGWPFTSSRNRRSPYTLLRNETTDRSIVQKNFQTVSDTNLIRDLHLKTDTIPDFKYPKFIPIYDITKAVHWAKISFNTTHPIPWFDIEASCLRMKDRNTVADLSRYLAEGKLYPLNDVSKKEIKKLESQSNICVNLDEAYSNEEIMDMYRMMHDMRRERQNVKMTKKNIIKPRSSSSSTSLSLSLSDGSLDSVATLDDQMFRMKERVTDARKNSMLSESESLDSFATSDDISDLSDVFESSVDVTESRPKGDGEKKYPNKEKETNLSRPSPRRFGHASVRHCEAVSNLVSKRLFTNKSKASADEPIVDLYVELVDGKIRPLCHIKAGMANLCLNTFFFPCTNIASVLWVPDIQEILRKVFKKCYPLKDIFGKHVSRLDAGSVSAVLFLSKSAKDIIKHKDLCMLDTLSVTLGIRQGSLLLLAMEQKPDELM